MSSKKKVLHLPELATLMKVYRQTEPEQDIVIFSTEQFTRGSGSPCRRCSWNSSISPRFHSSSFIQYHPGADGMQHHQHAVQPRPHAAGGVFVYSLKKAKTDIFSLSAHLPSLQFVTELPDSTKGGAKGQVMVGVLGRGQGIRRGPSLQTILSDSGSEKKGAPVDWVENASFACLNKLFEIDAKERQCKTLLTAWNLMGGRPGAPRISKRRKLVKNGKGVKELTPPREFAPPPIIHEAEVIIEEPVNPAPHSISSGSGHVAGLNHSSTSLAAVARLANLADEAASINHLDSPTPDVDAVEAICAAPMEKQGQKARVSPLTIRTADSCSGEGATFKEASLGAQSEVRTPRAASRSSARDRS
ncbi:hypothetical protein CK203_042006 [Vitis vinifera]|uniref:Uncharacterized protein n=1 Tax=Vitis vinifera TaxID=29760 RepID=A0A438I0D7_VITVI|nr:hypothetical protein CK203_042006 [Vitis vinifera]